MSMGEVVIGVDAHKRSHTLVAVDVVGRQLGERVVAATGEGHLQALEWASQWPEVRFALEDCRHVTRRLEQDLLAAGCTVVRVPTQLMAAVRRAGRQPGKSDPIDALAVARAALREPGQPPARLDGPAREIKLLSDHRRNLVTERTILCCRLRWHLHELDPGLQVPSRGLRRYCVLDGLAARLAVMGGVVALYRSKTRRMVPDLGVSRLRLGGLVVLADHASEYLPPPDWEVQRIGGLGFLVGRALLAGLVGPVPVVMAGVLAEDRSQVAFVVDEHPVGALGSCCAYPSLGVTVRPRRARRDLHYFQALAGEDLVEGPGELGVAVPDEEAEGTVPFSEIHD
jgi:hypothetical protein